MKEAREILEQFPELEPHTFNRRTPVPDTEAGHSNPLWNQPRGTYRADLLNKSDPVGPIHPDLPAGHPHRDAPHFNLKLRDGTKSTIIIRQP